MNERVRPLDPVTDELLLRACIIELQETERALDRRLPSGAEIVSAYTELLLQRRAQWDGCIFVAEDDGGAPLGIASVFAHVPITDEDEPAGTYALLKDLFVLPAGRRQGVGRALLQAAEAFARERGASVLRLEVMAGNKPAGALYESAGFRTRLVQMEKSL